MEKADGPMSNPDDHGGTFRLGVSNCQSRTPDEWTSPQIIFMDGMGRNRNAKPADMEPIRIANCMDHEAVRPMLNHRMKMLNIPRPVLDTQMDDGHFFCDDGHIFCDDRQIFFNVGRTFFRVGH